MSKGKGNGMLGVGGQRRNMSRSAMRGSGRGQDGNGAPQDPMADKRELLRKIQEKNKLAVQPEVDKPDDRDDAEQ